MNKKQTTIQLKQVSKKYILHHEKPTLVENLFKTKEEFWALKNINLEIKQGQKVGIIGPNGAGKSTLLKIITGITTPTKGIVHTQGNLASLIELSAGFHPDLTGMENIYINGLLIGMSKSQIDKNLKKIIDFSGVGKFIDTPLNTYSSGMKARLGFSIAIHSDPDILIIDEVISAGDEDFRKKSFSKIKEIFQKNKTVIYVSHALPIIKKLCPKTLWLEKGKIKMFGPSKKVIKKYQQKN